MAAEAQLEKFNLFEAGKGDYALYRIPGLVVTAKGTVLAYCEARRTGKSDWDTIDILLRRSTDGGKTWSPRVRIADVPGPKTKNPVALAQKLANPEDVTYNNPVAFANRDGSVQFLFCLEYCRCFSIRSDDDGLTWSPPVEITATFDKFRPEYDWKVLATGPGHGIQLKNGRLVVPVWLSTGTGGHAHRPSVTSTIFSDDNGKTWQRGDIAVPNTDEWINPNETIVVQLADGRVMLNVRSESKSHRRLVTISPDGATDWSKPRFDDTLLEPICMASIIRLTEMPASDKNRIVFANPHNLARADGKVADGKSRDRKNLSIKLSEDDGVTWPINKVLEPGMSAYSDLAVLPDGTILCLYERGRETDAAQKKPTSYALLTLARFNLNWLTDSTVPMARDWSKQAELDAKLDRTTIAYDGKTPNKLVCDTTLRELPNGSWSLFMLAGDDFEPSPKNYIGLTRSTDAGKNWSPLEPVNIGFPREGKTSGQGPTELLIRDGRCTLFFSTHSQTWGRDWKSWSMHSDDLCRTWSQPEPMPGRLANFTFIRNHIVTRDGLIVIPFQHYVGPGPNVPPPAAEEKPWHGALRHYVSNPRNGVLISSDGGKSWTEHGNIRLTDNDRYHGWAENNLAELSDGRIAMIIRGDRLGGVLYYAESKDGGRTWPEFATKTDIPNPGSKATLHPLGGDAVALLHNPNPSHRSPLALWVSFDGLKTWPYRRVLVPESCDGPKGRLNYPDGFVSRDQQFLHFAFDDNRHRAVYYGAKLPTVPKIGSAAGR